MLQYGSQKSVTIAHDPTFNRNITSVSDTTETAESSRTTERDVQRQVLIESLLFLYRSMPSAAFGHTVTCLFVAFALFDVVNPDNLTYWVGAIISVSIFRLGVTIYFQRLMIDLDDNQIKTWSRFLAGMTFVQTALWGSSVFLIWPEGTNYRAVLIVILAGIIAAGGIMLALNRGAFWIYCLPISIPVVLQLFLTGGRLELVLAFLVILYSVILLLSVNRLTNVFLEALRLRIVTQNESRTDALTGLVNRRGFDEALHDTWQQSIRSSQSLGLLSLDVDHFKKYNDHYGHPQGDEALRQLANVLMKVASRSTDLCARVGGEEFAVLMPVTDHEGSRQVAEAIQKELADAAIPHRNSERGVLTVSIGANVVTPGRNSNLDEFVENTDRALYKAKASGRNAIRFADE